MRTRPTRGLGFLGLSMGLHALLLLGAALWGVSAIEVRAPDLFTLTWKPPSRPPEELVVAEAPFEWAEEREEFELRDPGAGEPSEPELRESEPWDAAIWDATVEFPLAPVEPRPLEAVDLSPGHPFLAGGALGSGATSIGLGSTGTMGTGTPGTRAGLGSAATIVAEVAPPLVSGGGGTGKGSGIAELTPLATPRPAYPRLSVRANEEGSVLCRLLVAVDGSVTEVEIVESSGHPRLDEAAREALLGWRFDPRREDGRPVPARILHRITFQLTEG